MLETSDKGVSWNKLFVDTAKTVFFNSIRGDIAVGDPQGETLDILKRTAWCVETVAFVQYPFEYRW